MSSPAGGAPMQRKRLSVQSTHSKPLSLHRDGPGAAVRWGIVGCGWVARDHLLPGLRATPTARLVGACDRDVVAAARLATGHDDVLATADLDALLSRPGLDAVYVATPNSAHLPVVARVAARGIPVLCEKPLAADVDDAAAIVAACAGTPRRHRVRPAVPPRAPADRRDRRRRRARHRHRGADRLRLLAPAGLEPGLVPP